MLTFASAIAVLFGLFVLFSCIAFFSYRIWPFSGKLGAAVGCALLVIPSLSLTGQANELVSPTALLFGVGAGTVGGGAAEARGLMFSVSSIIVCGIAGVLGALAVNASGYAAVCFSQWSAGLLFPGPTLSELQEESAQNEDVRGTLRLVLLLLLLASLLYSPLASVFFHSLLYGFVTAVEQLSALSSMLASVGASEQEQSRVFLLGFRERSTEFAIAVGHSALMTAAIVALPLFVISIAVDLLSLLYRRFFRLGYAPTAVQVARFTVLLALLGSGTYIFIEQLQASFHYAPMLAVTDQT